MVGGRFNRFALIAILMYYYMEYSTYWTKRNILILGSSFLILSQLINGTFFFLKDSIEPDAPENSGSFEITFNI